MEAGQDESRFWEQTPRTFQAVMEGAQKRQHRAHELATFEAWQMARFGRETKLRRLDHYLAELKPKAQAQSPAEMLTVLKALASGGAGMTIRKVDAATE